jgi:hypothetical protein
MTNRADRQTEVIAELVVRLSEGGVTIFQCDMYYSEQGAKVEGQPL